MNKKSRGETPRNFGVRPESEELDAANEGYREDYGETFEKKRRFVDPTEIPDDPDPESQIAYEIDQKRGDSEIETEIEKSRNSISTWSRQDTPHSFPKNKNGAKREESILLSARNLYLLSPGGDGQIKRIVSILNGTDYPEGEHPEDKFYSEGYFAQSKEGVDYEYIDLETPEPPEKPELTAAEIMSSDFTPKEFIKFARDEELKEKRRRRNEVLGEGHLEKRMTNFIEYTFDEANKTHMLKIQKSMLPVFTSGSVIDMTNKLLDHIKNDYLVELITELFLSGIEKAYLEDRFSEEAWNIVEELENNALIPQNISQQISELMDSLFRLDIFSIASRATQEVLKNPNNKKVVLRGGISPAHLSEIKAVMSKIIGADIVNGLEFKIGQVTSPARKYLTEELKASYRAGHPNQVEKV